jgi:ornithine cyclodeaminase/alanine dehydrogenase-like protein (mu-crystallin family)
MCAVRPIELIKVYSPNREHRLAFAQQMSQELQVKVQVEDTPEAAVKGADIVCCCTNSFRHPVLRGRWLEEGMFVSDVLASELDEEAVSRIDHVIKNQPLRNFAAHTFEAGAPPQGIERPREGWGWVREVNESTPLLSQVITGRAKGRTNPKEITLFSNNDGTGIQFAAIGSVILAQLAREGDEGVKSIPLDWFVQDIPD